MTTPDTKPPTPAPRREHVALLVDQLLRGWREHDRYHVKKTSGWRPGLLRLIAVQLERVQFTAGDRGGGSHKVSGSPAPWADDLGGIWTDVHAGARTLERSLHMELHGTPLPVTEDVGTMCVAGFMPVFHVVRRRVARGPSDENTAAALQHIVELLGDLERKDPNHRLLAAVDRQLSSWVRRARQALGHDRRWQIVPAPCTGVVGHACNKGACTPECAAAVDDTARPFADLAPCCEQITCGAMAVRQDPYTGGARCMSCGATWTSDELGWVAEASRQYESA